MLGAVTVVYIKADTHKIKNKKVTYFSKSEKKIRLKKDIVTQII